MPSTSTSVPDLHPGYLSVNDYCHKMKGMTDVLRNLSERVEDGTLVLNILQCLNKKYDHLKMYLKRAKPFPSYDACNNLPVEITLGTEATSGSTTSLVFSDGKQHRPPLAHTQQYQPLPSLAPLQRPSPRHPPTLVAMVMEAAEVATTEVVALTVVVAAEVVIAATTSMVVVATVAVVRLHRPPARVGVVIPRHPSM
jgi:hypothetical protein